MKLKDYELLNQWKRWADRRQAIKDDPGSATPDEIRKLIDEVNRMKVSFDASVFIRETVLLKQIQALEALAADQQLALKAAAKELKQVSVRINDVHAIALLIETAKTVKLPKTVKTKWDAILDKEDADKSTISTSIWNSIRTLRTSYAVLTRVRSISNRLLRRVDRLLGES